MTNSSLQNETFIGSHAQEHRGLLQIKYPVTHGVVTDWDDMERVWSHVYGHELKISSEEHPLLLTEAPLNPRSNRSKAAQVLFETFNVPALYVAIQAVLALYGSGRGSGLVLDCGDGVTHAVPIFQGFAIENAIRRVDLAGRDVSDHLQLLLRKAGVSLETSAEREVVREIKEKMCYLALDPRREEKEWVNSRIEGLNMNIGIQPKGSELEASGGANSGAAGATEGGQEKNVFKLPDGRLLTLGPERFRAPEIMFNPELIGSESLGIHETLTNVIQRTDLDLRSTFYSNIVLSGGSTLTTGFGARLLDEMRKAAPANTKIKIFASPERKYMTWIGGSILGSLSTFQKMWVTVDEWHENPDMIHKSWM